MNQRHPITSYWDQLRHHPDFKLVKIPHSQYTRYKPTQPPNELPKLIAYLGRDYIHDSLYNPYYGYFSRHVSILQSHSMMNLKFNQFKDIHEFTNKLNEMYASQLTHARHQLWHTPTELFNPHYGNVIAKYLVESHLKNYPKEPLVIYEMGTGNGTLMMNILSYVQSHEPDLYKTMEYNAIEISNRLSRALPRHSQVKIYEKSIFEWNQLEQRPCYFLGFEVLDNFPHDVVRYDHITHNPLQEWVLIDEYGEYDSLYEPLNDVLIQEFISARESVGLDSPFQLNSISHKLRMQLPFAPNLTEQEFLPTKAFEFLKILKQWFPNHHLILSDFDQLPDAIPGRNAPVVQTMYQGQMVPCTTHLVQLGYFDIFFPTQFDLLNKLYEFTNGKKAQVVKHADFIKEYGNEDAVKLGSGENPLLKYYENTSFLLTL